MTRVQHEDSPITLYNKYQHLVKNTLYRLLGQPHQVALSNRLEIQDLIQYGNMGLWRACTTYDKKQSSFKSHAINHIRWSIMNGLNRSGLIKYDVNNMPSDDNKFDLISFDSPITNNSDDDLNYYDITPDSYDINKDTYNRLLLNEILPKLSERERKIVVLKSQDKTDREIAEQFGVTPQAINKTIKNIQKRFQNIKEEVLV